MEGKRVDIIVPIYNAYAELIQCVDSIKKWTDLEANRLVLINDRSSDEKIRPYLDSLKQKNVIVIHNKSNQGFSANINLGMQQSQENDVILLNSDTVVTRRWIEKMKQCAYSDVAIATVTPLSNNATLCSVPKFCEENQIPEGYTVDEYAELIENVSQLIYPEIPVAHGFCMYIKREVIDKIGGFDAETFEKGYGEENDFSYRAIQAGYKHVMCDDTFILHTGTSSFVSKEKQKLIQKHEQILDERYSTLMQNVRIHCRDNPNASVSENIGFWITFHRRKKRKTILYQIQSDFREDADNHVGGTQLHVKDLMSGCRDEYDIVVVARNRSYLNVTLYTQEQEFFLKYYIGKNPEYEVFRSKSLGKLYGQIIEQLDVNIVHIHHVLGMSHEMFYQAKKRGVPIYVTLHDFFYICPSATLLCEGEKLCIGKETKEMCQECRRKQQNISDTVPYIEIWQNESRQVLKMAEKIFTPSDSAKKVYVKYFQELECNIIVVPHGMEIIPQRKQKANRNNKQIFRVAFLGGINTAKGYQYATELIKKSDDKELEWYLFGKFQQQDPAVEKKKNFFDIGPYKRENLGELLQKYQIDLICILPIWPETFCYTVSEAILSGIPVLVTEIGALPERVQKLQCGWIVPYGVSTQQILQKICEIKQNKAEYQKVVEHIGQISLDSKKQMCEQYKKIYFNHNSDEFFLKREIDYEWFQKGIMTANGIKGIYKNGEEDDLQQAEEAVYQLEEILNSTSYRIVQILAKCNIPFRSQLRAVVRKMYRLIRKRK